MEFDARAAKLLQPGEHMIIDGRPGLRLVATTTRRTWVYRYKSPLDDRMRQIALGHWPGMRLDDADAAWRAARDQRDAGMDPAREKRAGRQAQKVVAAARQESRYTVRRLCDDYLAGHVDQRRAEKGRKEVRRQFETMLGPVANVPAESLSRRQAFDLLESYADRPVVAGQLRQELGAAWEYALDAGRLPEETPNWWRQIMRGRLKSRGKKIAGEPVGTDKRVLSEQEVADLIRWLPNFSLLVRDGLTLYLWTGMRGGEIVGIHAGEISEESDGLWLTVPKRRTKNARIVLATDLRVPLVGRAREVVERRLQETPRGYLFPSTGKGKKHIEQKTVGQAVHYHMPYSNTRPEVERPRLTVTHWAAHDLRRTVRTLLASLGCPAEVAEAILGHIQPGVQGIYNRHTYDKERREWLTRLSQKLEELAG